VRTRCIFPVTSHITTTGALHKSRRGRKTVGRWDGGLRGESVSHAAIRGQASSYLMDGPRSEPPPRPRGSRSLRFEATSSSSCGDCLKNPPRFPALPSLLAPAVSAKSQPPACTRRFLRGSGRSLPSSPNLLRSRSPQSLAGKKPQRAFFIFRNAPPCLPKPNKTPIIQEWFDWGKVQAFLLSTSYLSPLGGSYIALIDAEVFRGFQRTLVAWKGPDGSCLDHGTSHSCEPSTLEPVGRDRMRGCGG
jgi:hypothetical protein